MDLDFEKPILEIEQKIAELRALNKNGDKDLAAQITELESKLQPLLQRTYANLTPWQTVLVARHNQRPTFLFYVKNVFSEFIELHGDRHFGDDAALLGGFATIGKHRVMLLGTEKGSSVEEKVSRNFGMANPEGYRKALRLMRLAEKYGLPVVTLVDTPAAYPGKEAEERGQAEAIARNLMEMALLQVPLVAVITGEGGSGGALAIAVADSVLMLSNAIYSVIPPEGCAAILWRDAEQAPAAAEALKLTAKSLLDLKVIDEIVPEPPGGAHRDPAKTAASLKDALIRHLDRLSRISARKLVEQRFEKYARIGRVKKRRYGIH
ncbi:MAG: acetyl-CoA carboxylase carboxyltransferase subunit alpha [Kiritimatiellae bacterium]|nr:acetyl-CoA carboxylase carboxyltransferase subunit alpha [Kiritimatiellia bacterium]